jgi:hypothetical protein
MRLAMEMLRQPTASSCGPTCLHAVYRYYGLEIDLDRLIAEITELEGGGTLSVFLGQHALRNGFRARLVSYNLQIFDPTWWDLGRDGIRDRLERRIAHLRDDRSIASHRAYLRYLDLGGELDFFDLDEDSLSALLLEGAPVLTGLSATYLYRHARETPEGRRDDVAGSPVGHFVVATGWHAGSREVVVVDPFEENPFNPEGEYRVDVHRFINSVMLGIVTYDGNLLQLVGPGAGGEGR